MKKMIFLILALLPVFLIIIISVTGRLIKLYVPIPVEGVTFQNEDGEIITELEVGKDGTKTLIVNVFPELASNKKFSFTVLPESKNIFSLDEENFTVTGVNYGSAKLYVTTQEKKWKAELLIRVTDKDVTSVSLSIAEKTLSVGESFKLNATVLPYTALNRMVSWSSSDPSKVAVDANGNIYGASETDENTPIIITVTTDDGGFTAECAVTVNEDLPLMAFYRIGEEKPVPPSGSIPVKTNSILLSDYLRYDTDLINYNNIVFSTIAGVNSTLTGDIVQFSMRGNINIVAKVTVIINGAEVHLECGATFSYNP